MISPRPSAADGLPHPLAVRLLGRSERAVGGGRDITAGDGLISPRASAADGLPHLSIVRLPGRQQRALGGDVISPWATA